MVCLCTYYMNTQPLLLIRGKQQILYESRWFGYALQSHGLSYVILSPYQPMTRTLLCVASNNIMQM